MPANKSNNVISLRADGVTATEAQDNGQTKHGRFRVKQQRLTKLLGKSDPGNGSLARTSPCISAAVSHAMEWSSGDAGPCLLPSTPFDSVFWTSNLGRCEKFLP